MASAQALAERARRAELLVRVLPLVDRVVRHVLGGHDPEHEDIVQTSLERWLAWLGADVIRDERRVAQLAAIVAKNMAVDTMRARSRERRVLSRGDATKDTRLPASPRPWRVDPERVVAANEQLAHYADALSQLSAATAQVVYMHDVLGHELAEISLALGVSVAAAQSRLVRGRSRVVGQARGGPSPAR